MSDNKRRQEMKLNPTQEQLNVITTLSIELGNFVTALKQYVKQTNATVNTFDECVSVVIDKYPLIKKAPQSIRNAATGKIYRWLRHNSDKDLYDYTYFNLCMEFGNDVNLTTTGIHIPQLCKDVIQFDHQLNAETLDQFLKCDTIYIRPITKKVDSTNSFIGAAIRFETKSSNSNVLFKIADTNASVTNRTYERRRPTIKDPVVNQVTSLYVNLHGVITSSRPSRIASFQLDPLTFDKCFEELITSYLRYEDMVLVVNQPYRLISHALHSVFVKLLTRTLTYCGDNRSVYAISVLKAEETCCVCGKMKSQHAPWCKANKQLDGDLNTAMVYQVVGMTCIQSNNRFLTAVNALSLSSKGCDLLSCIDSEQRKYILEQDDMVLNNL